MNADSRDILLWSLIGTDSSGCRVGFDVHVGIPEFQEEPFATWFCEFLIKGRMAAPMPVFGATPVQALNLCTSVVRSELAQLSTEYRLLDSRTGDVIDPRVFEEAGLRG